MSQTPQAAQRSIAVVSLFDKFRAAGSSFGEWLLPPETPLDVKPISEEIAQKLRQRQSAMALPSTVLVVDRVEAPAAAAATSTPEPEVSGEGHSENVLDADDDNDKESSNVTQAVTEPLPSSAPSDTAFAGRGAAISSSSSTFLAFGPSVVPIDEKKAASSKLSAEQLQAVVTLPASDAHHHSDSSPGRGNPRRRGAAATAASPNGVEGIRRTVPLWSVERFKAAGGYCESNALVALHEEIMDLVDYLSPSQAEVSLRRFIELEVGKIAKRLWPDCEPCVYGSLNTQLLLPLSDIDMSILNVPVSTEEALVALSREIGNADLCTTAFPQLILKTKVPLLKFTHKGSLLDVDVSINAGDGKTNSAIVRTYLQQYPEARPLIMVVKYFLQQRDMHEPYHGGLGSFAATLLVISFLQHHPIYATRPHERPFTGLGKLLVDFFRYYGCCFNYQRCGVSLDNGGFYFMRKQQMFADPSRPVTNQVILEDPGNRANNAASSLRVFPSIASSFAHAYAALTAVFRLVGDGSPMSPDNDRIELRPTLLSRILHVDADSVARRKCIIDTFDAFQADPESAARLAEVLAYKRPEDAPMLRRMPLSNVDGKVARAAAKAATAATPVSAEAPRFGGGGGVGEASTAEGKKPSVAKSPVSKGAAAATSTGKAEPTPIAAADATAAPSPSASTAGGSKKRARQEAVSPVEEPVRAPRQRRVYKAPQ